MSRHIEDKGQRCLSLGSQLHFTALVALDTQSGVYQEFGREMAGMPSVRRYKDVEIVSDREIFYVDCALGETRTSKVTKWNGRYTMVTGTATHGNTTGTGTGRENGTGKKRLSEAEETKEKEACDELDSKVEEE
ncbi:uncharacterized protein ARMOST_01807 [Armillaria ostoyae]|uniref:Uncharacterized protein n=1 Tax=Armillaria ostoyae TaxID=47428 RepID=A0A284QPZ4_ARMOS|nr:uncharacterized protein ARMOST_01807 [Armillaria ostoyae]